MGDAQKQRNDQDTFKHTDARIRRNAPCPCGSGKCFKHCCKPKAPASRLPWSGETSTTSRQKQHATTPAVAVGDAVAHGFHQNDHLRLLLAAAGMSLAAVQRRHH